MLFALLPFIDSSLKAALNILKANLSSETLPNASDFVYPPDKKRKTCIFLLFRFSVLTLYILFSISLLVFTNRLLFALIVLVSVIGTFFIFLIIILSWRRFFIIYI